MTASEGVVNSNLTIFFVIFTQVCRGLIKRDMRNTSFLRNITDNFPLINGDFQGALKAGF